MSAPRRPDTASLRRRGAHQDPATAGQAKGTPVKVVVTRIGQDGSVWRRTVDTAGRDDRAQWEANIARVLADEPPYQPLPGSPVCHVRFDDHVVLVAEHDLAGPLRDLVTAVLAGADAA